MLPGLRDFLAVQILRVARPVRFRWIVGKVRGVVVNPQARALGGIALVEPVESPRRHRLAPRRRRSSARSPTEEAQGFPVTATSREKSSKCYDVRPHACASIFHASPCFAKV